MTMEFSSFVKSLLEINSAFEDFRDCLLQSDVEQILFNKTGTKVSVPEHCRGNHSRVVLNRKIEITTQANAPEYIPVIRLLTSSQTRPTTPCAYEASRVA